MTIRHSKKILKSWSPLQISYQDDEGKNTDFPRYTPGRPIFNDKAVTILNPLLEELVEFLPLRDSKYKFFFCNVLNVFDCVDTGNSIPETTRGTLIRYKKLYFKEAIISNSPKRHIFKIPELITHIFVSDEFKDEVLKHGLKGLDFEEIWDSEFTKKDEIVQQERYDNYLTEIEQNKGTEMDWNKAMKLLDEGRAVASAHWKLQKDEGMELLVGQLTYDLDYEFAKLIYIPPILLDLKWHEVERSV